MRTYSKEAMVPATKQTEKNVECQDCGKQFTTLKDIPKCPRCDGTEVSYLFRPCS